MKYYNYPMEVKGPVMIDNSDQIMKKKYSFLTGLAALTILFSPISSSVYANEINQVNTDVYEDVIDDVKGGITDIVDGEKVTFDDIQGHWAQFEIEVLANTGIVKGKLPTSFEPNSEISRAEFISLVVRAIVGEESAIPAAEGELTFKDLQQGAYYVNAVQFAAEKGLVNGDGNGNFKPQDNITRQEIAKIIGNTYTFVNGKAIAEGDINAEQVLSQFSDHSLVAPWAQNEMAFLVAKGILKGVGNSQLDSAGNATRAQSAVMLYRIITSI